MEYEELIAYKKTKEDLEKSEKLEKIMFDKVLEDFKDKSLNPVRKLKLLINFI